MVCYSQTIIILILLLGYIINNQNTIKSVTSEEKLKCFSCGKILLKNDSNYCSYCGHMTSHSKGSKLEK